MKGDVEPRERAKEGCCLEHFSRSPTWNFMPNALRFRRSRLIKHFTQIPRGETGEIFPGNQSEVRSVSHI